MMCQQFVNKHQPLWQVRQHAQQQQQHLNNNCNNNGSDTCTKLYVIIDNIIFY